jgi:hypothetical protein
MIKRNHCVLDEIIYLDKLMKHGFGLILRFSFILIVFVLFAPSSTLIAQDDSGEEVFWGDDESEDEEMDFGEDFDMSEDEEFGDEEFGDEEFGDEEFGDEEFGDEEFGDEEFGDEEFDDEEFGDDFAEDPQESSSVAASRLGYTLNIIGSSPGFVNHQLSTYNSGMDFRAAFEFPMLLSMGPFRFRVGAEVGTFKFTNYKPIGGTYSGVHITGLLSFPAGPSQVRLGAGMVGKGFGFIAENSYGFAVGESLDIRFGVRSTTSFSVADDKSNKLGTVSWMDGILALSVSL